jgi:hypothetical protein
VVWCGDLLLFNPLRFTLYLSSNDDALKSYYGDASVVSVCFVLFKIDVM